MHNWVIYQEKRTLLLREREEQIKPIKKELTLCPTQLTVYSSNSSCITGDINQLGMHIKNLATVYSWTESNQHIIVLV